MKIRIQPGTEDDLPEILAIYNNMILHTTAVYDEEPHTLDMRKAWFKQKQLQGFPVLVAKIEHEVAGFATYGSFRAWSAYKYTVEHSLYVKENFQQKGIGKLLLQALIDCAKTNKLHTMIAGIDAANQASLALHAQFGFQQAAYLKEVGYKFGKWLDLKLLQLIL
jgi:phosphinothricin acetyltransferase